MEKLIPIVLFISLLLIGNVLFHFIIKVYYKRNNFRLPYEKWYGYKKVTIWYRFKKDVTLREKLILSALQQVPFVIFYASYIIYKY